MDELLDFAPCGFVSLGNEGSITQINATLCELVGYSACELQGEKFEKILTIGGRVFFQTHFLPMLNIQGKAEEIYFSLRSNAGVEIPVLVNAITRQRAQKMVFDCILVPMHQRNRYENELLEARRAAQEASQAKDDFLAVVSHELRTPLNAILGWAQLVREGLDEKTFAQAMEIIERSGQAQVQIIEDILDVARLQNGKLSIDKKSVVLSVLICETVAAMEPAMHNRHLACSLHIESEVCELCVNGDAGRLRQIVQNLLANAIKFTPPGGHIGVRLERDQTRLRCEISDDGQGIAPELLPRVFERFQQGDSSSTRRAGGLGLGLALVHSLLEMHGGRIEATSDGPGRGATFTFWLPIWKYADSE